ncbi:MAG: hypothetical protein ACKVX7_16925 [Planctomycetota bacterium]
MSTAIIFGVGVFVVAITSMAILSVGLGEAADPHHSRSEDLTAWERALVRRESTVDSSAGDKE